MLFCSSLSLFLRVAVFLSEHSIDMMANHNYQTFFHPFAAVTGSHCIVVMLA